jgi:hypothetical protein
MNNRVGVCSKTSNNKYLNCPARSYAGGAFTDWRPSCDAENNLRLANGLHSNYAYRQWLINNATNIMNVNRQYNEQKNGCQPCNAQDIPVASMCYVDRTSAVCKSTNCGGIGQRSVAVEEPRLVNNSVMNSVSPMDPNDMLLAGVGNP